MSVPQIFRQGHIWLSAIFFILLLPASYAVRLTPQFSLTDAKLLGGWVILSIFWAALLYQVSVPGSWAAYRSSSPRLLLVIPLLLGMALVYGPAQGILAAVAVFAIAEFYFRAGDWQRAAGALLPWLYLVAGIKIAAYFSAVIVSLRPCTEYDPAFARLDSFLLHGGSVVQFSNASAALYSPAEFIYYCMFGAMGTGILFLCLAGDSRAALQMSGSILTAYYLSLLLFYFFPAQGPFVTAGLPPRLLTAQMESNSLTHATALFHHTRWLASHADYYVAFPSLHIAQPLIAAWFLRRWRVLSTLVFGYCVLLAPAILILRWHYVTDILGGLAVAVLAVIFVRATSSRAVAQAAHPSPAS